MIRVGNFIYNKINIYSNELIKCGEVKMNFEGVEYIVWFA